MATIKLKSSTGTRTVPSSLAQGEFAINVADGNLFYGDNSSNVNNDFRFAQLGVSGLTSGATTHATTLSGGSGGVYGTLQTVAQTNITSVGVLTGGQFGTDEASLRAYINSGEIDGVTMGSETRIASLKTNNIDISPEEGGVIPFLLKAHAEPEGNYVTITNSSDDVKFKIDSAGRTTISTATLTIGTITTADINGGNIDGTAIGATTPQTSVFTSTKATNLSGSTGEIKNDLMVSGNTYFTDDGKAIFGTGQDLKIYHSGSHSIIQDSGTGDLHLKGSVVKVRGTSVSEDCAVFTENGNVELFYDNSKKIETVTGGVHITGTLSANTSVLAGTGVDDGVISANTVQGSYTFITFVGNTGGLSDDEWTGPSTNGISNHSWVENWDGVDGTSTGSTALSVSRSEQHSYIRVPAGTRLVGLEGVIRSSVNDRAYAGLFTYLPDYEGPDASSATLRILARTPSSSNNVSNDPQSIKEYAAFADQHVFADGECIVPAFRRDSSSTQTLVGSLTIILKY